MNPLRSMTVKLSVLTCLFVLGVIGLMSRRLLQRTEQGLFTEMKVRAEFFARSSRESIFPKLDPFNLHFNVKELLKEKAVTYAAVLDSSGKVLSHSDASQIGEHPADARTAAALAAEGLLLQPYRTASGEAAYDLSAPIIVGTRRVGTARLGFDNSSVQEALRQPKRQILVIAAGSTALAVLGTVLIVGWMIRPLPRLAEAVREVGRGNFDVQVEVTSRDEIGVVGRAFNEMAVANKLLFAAIKEEKEKLERIFHDTQEGVVLTDPKGRVLLINAAARALLGCPDKPGAKGALTVAEAAAAFEVTPPLAEVLKGADRAVTLELRRAKPKLLILDGVADRLGDPGDHAGFLFIIRDATLEKRGETLARNLLSLVSHKLRTPLAVALGFLELMESDRENLTDFQKQALKKIQQEDEHLRALVEKLLTFSAAQSPETIVLERAELSLPDVTAAALKSLKQPFPGAAVSWPKEEFAKLPRFEGDPLLLKEVLFNLLENALKFNRREDKKAKIAAIAKDGRLRVSVLDNGPGVPSEERPKLFRKFYQIDEDFTGQIPGMGLGLAFVKNVVAAHGGEVGLDSEVGKGSEFWFTLPLK
ncbi:MAG: HAMP domain-containing protein [Elusimicrobia bacterium]|nr:HAMP domain-containing protein [Elusimicrobiota bacterium]